jgi:hypothetical protein
LAVFGPVEYDDDVFNAIQIAVANGFVVVEAAGNGGVNLDQAACGSKFDRNVRDSGAIIVGAGGTPGSNDRERLGFSSYGSRVDLQGWGQNVVTTGYGDLYTNPDDPNNPNFWYTSTFNGTSSASPIVAGAAANLQGISLERFGTFLPSSEIRQLLVETGSPQQGDTSENIGTRPDLRAAITAIKDGVVERACPLDARAGRIVVEFPEDVVLTTRSQSENSFGPLTVDIPAGTYDITLVSFDDHIEQPQEEDQKQESWFLQTENEKGDIVFESNPISDLPKAQNILEELVQEHARITKDITGLSAKHILDVGESDTAESVGPVCAAFDRVEKDRDREDKDK